MPVYHSPRRFDKPYPRLYNGTRRPPGLCVI